MGGHTNWAEPTEEDRQIAASELAELERRLAEVPRLAATIRARVRQKILDGSKTGR